MGENDSIGIHDFSISDQKQAARIVNKQKLKLMIKHLMKDKHTEIEMFENRIGIKSLKECSFNNVHDKIGIPVKSKVISEDEDPIQETTRIVSLNQTLSNKEINNVHLDEQLVEQLLIQDLSEDDPIFDGSVRSPFKLGKDPSITPGKPRKDFVHAFDVIKE